MTSPGLLSTIAYQWVTILFCIREVQISNIGPQTTCPGWGSHGFSTPSTKIPKKSFFNYAATASCRFLSHSLFTNYHIIRHLVICNNETSLREQEFLLRNISFCRFSQAFICSICSPALKTDVTLVVFVHRPRELVLPL
jgi:hypothetical protein